jgi:hypothetical protein
LVHGVITGPGPAADLLEELRGKFPPPWEGHARESVVAHTRKADAAGKSLAEVYAIDEPAAVGGGTLRG